MKILFIAQGIFYLLTALWPLLHMKSFEAVSGPKKDKWLVYTVSALLIGPSLIFTYVGLGEEPISKTTIFLSLSVSLSLAIIDIVFVLKRVIWKTYLLDALAEILIFGLMVYFILN